MKRTLIAEIRAVTGPFPEWNVMVDDGSIYALRCVNDALADHASRMILRGMCRIETYIDPSYGEFVTGIKLCEDL